MSWFNLAPSTDAISPIALFLSSPLPLFALSLLNLWTKLLLLCYRSPCFISRMTFSRKAENKAVFCPVSLSGFLPLPLLGFRRTTLHKVSSLSLWESLSVSFTAESSGQPPGRQRRSVICLKRGSLGKFRMSHSMNSSTTHSNTHTHTHSQRRSFSAYPPAFRSFQIVWACVKGIFYVSFTFIHRFDINTISD